MIWYKALALSAILLLVNAGLCACPTQPAESEISNSPPAQPQEELAINSPPAQPHEELVSNSPPVQPQEEQGSTYATVRVIATQNFGRELMFDEILEMPPDFTAMAALDEVAEIETTYGGGFVNAINGVSSGFTGIGKTKRDWFIYVNGIQSNVGALDYKLQPGDVEHWDFHDWSFRQFIPAIVGAFPEPFLHGYRGQKRSNLIIYSDNLREEAQELKNGLVPLGVNDATLRSINELPASEKEASNLILLGTADNELISELNQNWKKLGLFVRFENGNLVILNAQGETDTTYGTAAGLIQATQNPWNPNGIGACENVAWMVTGTDESGVRSAIETLLKHHDQLQHAFAVVIANGEIIKIPQ
jgi:hypothetical protein